MRRATPCLAKKRTGGVMIAPVVPSFEERVKAIEDDWATNPRWEFTTRHYKPIDVVRLQGSLPPLDSYSKQQSDKAWRMFTKMREDKDCAVTFGALDPVQIVQMSKYARAIYVSGWQCSSTHTTTNEVGPDLADYPMNSVPDKVDGLVKALRFHDKKQWQAHPGETGPVDYNPPIIADADTGHGGLTAVAKLTKLFIDAGAAGGHFEDQRPGSKKCGHMGGKVLVSMQEHCDRLMAVRLQADILGSSFLAVARTDAEAGSLIDNNGDARDHEFIKGVSSNGKCDTFIETVAATLDKADAQKWREATVLKGKSLAEMKDLAKTFTKGSVPEFDWEACRTRDGFFQYSACVNACIARGKAFAPYADLCWMETAKPGIAQAKAFSDALKPFGKFLAYNLSPSFNWDAAGMTDAQISSFCQDLANMGYVFQFITLAGFHGSGLIADQLASKLIPDKDMLAYVKMIQRVEREKGIELLTHQKWAGAGYIDAQLSTIRGGADDIGINAAGNTEDQFGKKK